MTLREKQSIFVLLVAKLIIFTYEQGYELTFGEAYRSFQEASRLAKLGVGIKESLHTLKLAIDLNLFINGIYQTDSISHKPLGEWWESQSTTQYKCIWGGRFGDGNHYSIAYGGRK